MQSVYDLTIDLPDGSWTFANGLRRGIVEDSAAFMAMSSQTLNNPDLQRRMLELLRDSFNLSDGQRERAKSL